jgi:hypothetical protein
MALYPAVRLRLLLRWREPVASRQHQASGYPAGSDKHPSHYGDDSFHAQRVQSRLHRVMVSASPRPVPAA